MVCGEIDGFTIYIFFSLKVTGRVKRRMKNRVRDAAALRQTTSSNALRVRVRRPLR